MIEENVVYQGKLHWIIFLPPFILLCVMGFISVRFAGLIDFALAMSVIAVIWGFMSWLTYHFSTLLIKNKQVILVTGVLVRNTIDIPLNKIACIDIRQSIFGSLLHYGTLVITGTGGTSQYIKLLNRPLTCRRYIEQLMHAT